MLSEQDLANRWGVSVRTLQDWHYKKNGLAQSISLYHQQGGCAVAAAHRNFTTGNVVSKRGRVERLYRPCR